MSDNAPLPQARLVRGILTGCGLGYLNEPPLKGWDADAYEPEPPRAPRSYEAGLLRGLMISILQGTGHHVNEEGFDAAVVAAYKRVEEWRVRDMIARDAAHEAAPGGQQ